MKNNIIKSAALNAVLTSAYVVAIASFLFYVPKSLRDMPDTVFIPIVMLSLLVFSAALVGTLIFGKPLMWYFDGKKKEALLLLFYTLGFFFVLTIIAFYLLTVFG